MNALSRGNRYGFTQAGDVESGPDLPYETNRHCVVRVNATHFMLTGGLNTHGDWNIERRDAYLLEWSTGEWTRLRDMRHHRMGHGCARLGERQGRSYWAFSSLDASSPDIASQDIATQNLNIMIK